MAEIWLLYSNMVNI